MIHGSFFWHGQKHTRSISRGGTRCTLFRRNMCGCQKATTVTLNTLQKDCRSILMALYSSMFMGGSRLSTRVRRSKSLPSNFLMKGWFCNNRNGNSAQLTQMNGANSNSKLSIRKLLNQRKAMLTKSSEADILSAGSFCMLQSNIAKYKTNEAPNHNSITKLFTKFMMAVEQNLNTVREH